MSRDRDYFACLASQVANMVDDLPESGEATDDETGGSPGATDKEAG